MRRAAAAGLARRRSPRRRRRLARDVAGARVRHARPAKPRRLPPRVAVAALGRCRSRGCLTRRGRGVAACGERERHPGGFTRSVYVPVYLTSTRSAHVLRPLLCAGGAHTAHRVSSMREPERRVAPSITLHTRACPGPDSLCPSGPPRQSSSWVWCLRKAKNARVRRGMHRCSLSGGQLWPRAATMVRAGGVRGVRIACTLAPMAPCIPRPPSGTCPWPQWFCQPDPLSRRRLCACSCVVEVR